MALPSVFVVASALFGFVNANANANILTAGPLPRLHVRQASACIEFADYSSSCEDATPGFATIPAATQLSCYCGQSGFESVFAGCLNFVSTAEPDLYSSLESFGLNTAVCDILENDVPVTATDDDTSTITTRGGSTPTATGGSDSGDDLTDDPNYEACTSLGDLENECSSVGAAASDLAACYCYSSSTFAPETYDGLRESCLSYYQSANPPRYQQIIQTGGGVTSPCSRTGDFLAGQTTFDPPRTTTPTTTSSTTRGAIVPPGRTSSTSTTTSPNMAPTDMAAGGVSLMAAIGALALAVAL